MHDNESQFDSRLGPIMDELLERARNGNPPSFQEYAQKYPDLADELRDLFETLFLMEGLGKSPTQNRTGKTSDNGAIPKRLGEFNIVREIGRGGMGIVYEAVQESLGRHVAVKVLPHSTVLSADQIQRFHREARSAASLQHKNIVPVFGVGEENGLHFYVMQYIEGRPLDDVLTEVGLGSTNASPSKTSKQHQTPAPTSTIDFHADNDATVKLDGEPKQRFKTESTSPSSITSSSSATDSKPVSQSELTSGDQRKYFQRIAKLAADVAEALDYAHAEGVLHRDIKPSNLLVDDNNHVWITDFGLAKSGDDDLTHTGDLIGTLRYMPPERLHGWSDPRSDVYSLGLTLYEMATLQHAFPTNDRVELLKMLQHDEPARPRKLAPNVPNDLETIILKAIAKEPQQRYSSGGTMAEDLKRFVAGKPVFAKRSTIAKRFQLWYRRQPFVAALCAIVLILLITVAIVSTIFAVQMNDRLGEVIAANDTADARLFQAYLSQARASRFSSQPGRRFEGLAAVANATRLFPAATAAQEQQLRNELIACLTLDDVQLECLHPSNSLTTVRIHIGFDAQNSRLAQLNSQGQVELIDVDTGNIIKRFEQQWAESNYTNTRISPCGTRIGISGVTQSNEQKIVLLDTETGETLFERPLDFEVGLSICFSQDRELVAFVNKYDVMVVNAKSGELLHTIRAQNISESLEFLNSNRLLMNGSVGFELYDEDQLLHQRWFSSERMKATATNYAQNRFAYSGKDGEIRIVKNASLLSQTEEDSIDMETSCPGHFLGTTNLAFHPTRPFLISTGYDAKSRIWDANSGTEIIALDERGIQFSESGDTIGFSNMRNGFGRLRFVASRSCMQLRSYDQVMGSIVSLSFSPDNKFLLTVSWSPNELTLWDLETGQRLTRWKIKELIRSITFDPNDPSQFLVTKTPGLSDGNGGIELCRINESTTPQGLSVYQIEKIRTIKNQGHFHHTEFIKDGSQLVVGVENQDEGVASIETWTWPELEKVNSFNRNSWTEYMACRSDGKFAALSGHGLDWLTVHDLETGLPVKNQMLDVDGQGMENGSTSSFSHDGKLMVLAEATKVTVFSTEDWQAVATIPRDGQGVGDATFSPDNQYLAVAHLDHVGLYQNGSFKELAKLQTANPQQVSGIPLDHNPTLTFDGSSRYLAVGTINNSIQLWDLQLIREKLRELDLDW